MSQQQQPKVHDASDFPIVRLERSSIYEGYGALWCAEMDEFLARGKPFVLIYVHAGGPDEAHDDRVMRAAWLKSHKEMLDGILLAVIHVEPEPTKRAQLEKKLPMLAKAFGTPQAVRASRDEAEALGRHVLAGGRMNDSV